MSEPTYCAITTTNYWPKRLATITVSAGEMTTDENGDHRGIAVIEAAAMNYFWCAVQQAFGEVAAGLGRINTCREIFDHLLPFRGRFGITGAGSACSALATRTLGQLALAMGGLVLAEELLAEAIEQADRIEFTFERAIARRLLAEANLDSGGNDGARQLLTEAVAIADEHGFARELDLINKVIGEINLRKGDCSVARGSLAQSMVEASRRSPLFLVVPKMVVS
jgi:ATP/maltotriose-dependent transcriptional regulator MalT